MQIAATPTTPAPSASTPPFTEVFPGTREGAFYISKPGEAFYLLEDGKSKVPFVCTSWVKEVRADGGKWRDHIATEGLGDIDVDVDFRYVPETNRVRIKLDGTWNGNPYQFDQEYAVTQAKQGYFEFVNVDGSTKDPYYFATTPAGNGAYNLNFEMDVPGLGRMFKNGTIWTNPFMPGAAK